MKHCTVADRFVTGSTSDAASVVGSVRVTEAGGPTTKPVRVVVTCSGSARRIVAGWNAMSPSTAPDWSAESLVVGAGPATVVPDPRSHTQLAKGSTAPPAPPVALPPAPPA